MSKTRSPDAIVLHATMPGSIRCGTAQ